MDFEEYENGLVPKHKKKSKKTVKKSNHKHIYQPCLVVWDTHILKGERCEVCGKIGDVNFFETEPVEGRPHLCRLLGGQAILDKYPDLDIYDYKTGEKVEI